MRKKLKPDPSEKKNLKPSASKKNLLPKTEIKNELEGLEEIPEEVPLQSSNPQKENDPSTTAKRPTSKKIMGGAITEQKDENTPIKRNSHCAAKSKEEIDE